MPSYYSVYIVASRTRVLYTGVTGNLERRMHEHRAAPSNFSGRYRCDRLVWFEQHSEPLAALAREKEIKGWTRAKKIALIQSTNRTWEDLSQTWGEPIRYPQAEDQKADPSLRSG